MKYIIKGIKRFVVDINLFLNTILLIVVYLFGVGLTSIVAKVFRKRFLDNRKKSTYWSSLNLKNKPMKEYYKQF